MKIIFEGRTYEFDKNKNQRVELHKGWDQYGNGSISLYDAITPYRVLETASYPNINRAVLVRVDERDILRLNANIESDCSLKVLTYQDGEGRQAVRNSLELIVRAALIELKVKCGFQIICEEKQLSIQLETTCDVFILLDKLKELIRMNLPLRKLLMQVSSAKEILQYTGNIDAYNILEQYDEDAEITLCQFKKYYGIAESYYYVDTSGWFAHCFFECDRKKNHIVVSEI